MSVVIAYKKGDTVYMGADSKRSKGEFTSALDPKYDTKIYKINGGMLIGAVGTVGCIQTMVDNRNEWFDTKGKPLTKKFIVQNVIPKFYESLKKENKIKNDKDKPPISKCCFCVTDGKKMFHIDDDFTVIERSDYFAIGCTDYIAYAHIRYTKKEEPNEIILDALRGSVYRNDGVGKPYILIDTENFKITEVKE